jgi:hypothetical protein
MTSQPRTIYYLHKSEEFAEPIRDDRVVRMDAALVIFKGVYLGQSEITPEGMERGKLSLSQIPTHTLLRPVPSSDGPLLVGNRISTIRERPYHCKFENRAS